MYYRHYRIEWITIAHGDEDIEEQSNFFWETRLGGNSMTKTLKRDEKYPYNLLERGRGVAGESGETRGWGFFND